MAEKDTIFAGKIKQTGLFDFKDFYSFTYDWLLEEGYDLTEKAYNEKVAGDSKDIEIQWDATKKVSDYFKFQIQASWKILGMKTVEVDKNGKKVKIQSGQVEIKFKAVLQKDYEKKLFLECNELITQCKSFLAIEGKYY